MIIRNKKSDDELSLSASLHDANIEEVEKKTLRSRTISTDAMEDDNDDWKIEDSLFPVISLHEFIDDYYYVKNAIFAGPMVSYAYKRLEILTAKFNLHELLNGGREAEATKSVPHRDFYNVRKVDTHVHHSACMNQKHLLRFIKHKLKHTPNEAVVFRDGKFLTLEEVFKSQNLSAYELNLDTLDMHANSNTFHRFDRFNLKYNPAGQSRLREIFLKTENVIGGKYLAEITKEVMNDLEVRCGKYGFFSAHASNSIAGSVFLFKLFSNNNYTVLNYFLLVWVIVFSYSRIYLGVHYPLDIIFGLIVGFVFGILSYKIAEKLILIRGK